MTKTVFINGQIFTGTGEKTFVGSFGVDGDRVAWAGEPPPEWSADEEIDLGGACVLPGLLDVHTHPAMLSNVIADVSCLPPRVDSLESMIEAMRAHPDLGAGDDRWICGFGYDESGWPQRRHPDRHDLDRVSSTQPVIVRRCDAHTAACNSEALRRAGITRDTADPPAGHIARDADGDPTGLLLEPAAVGLVERHRPPVDDAQRVQRLVALNEHFLSEGIVAVDDMWATVIDRPYEQFTAAARQGLDVQVGLFYSWPQAGTELPEVTDSQRTGRVRVAGVKLFLDGAYSNRTAWVEEPYPGSCDHGMPTSSDEDLHAAVAWARRNRVQAAMHAMGDRAINRVLTLFEDTDPWLEDRPSIRIEHATLFSPQMLDRLNAARMRFGVVSHTIFMYAEFGSYENNLSRSQFEVAYPIRSYYERVTSTALASDTPATAWAEADHVFTSVQAAVTRQAHTGADMGQQESVTLGQALMLYTGRAAAVTGARGVGRLAPGAEASFVVLDRDPFTLPPTELATVHPAQTWLRGALAWQA